MPLPKGGRRPMAVATAAVIALGLLLVFSPVSRAHRSAGQPPATPSPLPTATPLPQPSPTPSAAPTPAPTAVPTAAPTVCGHCFSTGIGGDNPSPTPTTPATPTPVPVTPTPTIIPGLSKIDHVVILMKENRSFDE